jgi:thiol-disulfide isomerase/thioredoxin
MRKNLLLLACVLLLPLWGAWIMGRAAPDSSKAPPGAESAEMNPVPAFTFRDLNGRTHSEKDFRGKVLLLNFWASWCIPCRHEFPMLLDIARKNKDVRIVALSLDDGAPPVEKFLRAFGGRPDNFIVGIDKGQKISHDMFESVLVPETIIVTPEGRMSGKIAGGGWEPADMNARVRAAAGGK